MTIREETKADPKKWRKHLAWVRECERNWPVVHDDYLTPEDYGLGPLSDQWPGYTSRMGEWHVAVGMYLSMLAWSFLTLEQRMEYLHEFYYIRNVLKNPFFGGFNYDMGESTPLRCTGGYYHSVDGEYTQSAELHRTLVVANCRAFREVVAGENSKGYNCVYTCENCPLQVAAD